ncbi:ketoacyl-ACP synthase III [Candidatus Poribacteria bacterium]|nr:ketoacyl-ACP synthase III [Candidatus Poribacteria bacterium]
MTRTAVIGTGSELPTKVITNADLEQMVETSDEWIRKRTGIAERRITDESTASSDIGTAAAQRAIDDAGISASEIDCIICSTVSPDMGFPSTACFIANNLHLRHVPAFDLAAACAGYSYAIHVADGLIRSGVYRTVLVVAAETLTKFVNWSDRATCVLFGDASGAAVLRGTNEDRGVLHSEIGAETEYSDPELLGLVGGGSRLPASESTVRNRDHTIRMRGQEVFRLAVGMMPDVTQQVLDRAGIGVDAIDLFIPHQANVRIMEAFSERLGIPMERTFINIDRYGNTSSATAAVALDEALRTRRISRGGTVLIVTFGAGWTWGVNIIRV